MTCMTCLVLKMAQYSEPYTNIATVLQVITPFRNLVLCAETRKEMEEWIAALRHSAKRQYVDVRTSVVHSINTAN